MRDLVLIHGWGFDSRVWRPVADRLKADCRLHLLDLPGYGESGTTQAIPAGATVCAWSLGALQAMAWAAADPGRIARLVLVGATPRFVLAADWPDAQPPAMLESFAAAVAAEPRSALRRFAALINQGDTHGRRLTRELSALLADSLPAPGVLAAGLTCLAQTDLRALVARIPQPALVIHGDHDPLMPLAAARWLAAQLPRGRLETFADAAHAPFLSQPERFAERLLAFTDV